MYIDIMVGIISGILVVIMLNAFNINDRLNDICNSLEWLRECKYTLREIFRWMPVKEDDDKTVAESSDDGLAACTKQDVLKIANKLAKDIGDITYEINKIKEQLKEYEQKFKDIYIEE